MEVSVTSNSNETWLLPLSMSEFRRALGLMAADMRPTAEKPSAVELTLLDEAAMAGLNRDFLGLPGPTNVLSFPPDIMGGTGSLALAVRTVWREAWLYGQDLDSYTLRMLAHGLAHLMGHEHGPEMDIEVERAVEAASVMFAPDK